MYKCDNCGHVFFGPPIKSLKMNTRDGKEEYYQKGIKIRNLFILFIFMAQCANYNFEYGSSLAHFQDQKFKDYNKDKPLTEEEKTRFEKNLWVKTATRLAPSNLVIRHYCLMDLYSKKSSHKRVIKNQLDLLGADLYLEGYSYWLYTKPMLVEYQKKFGEFDVFIKEMDKKFERTAYRGLDGKLYPAPFGDLRHIPLEMESQSAKPVSEDTEISPLIIKILTWSEPSPELHTDTTEYFVQKCPLGANTHIPDKSQTVRVLPDGAVCVFTDGGYSPFRWYEGYDKKYGSKEEEFNDTFSKNRRLSIFNYKEWWEKYQEIFIDKK